MRGNIVLLTNKGGQIPLTDSETQSSAPLQEHRSWTQAVWHNSLLEFSILSQLKKVAKLSKCLDFHKT